MTIEQDVLEQINNVEILDLNANHHAKQADESFSLTNDIEKIISPIRNDTVSLESPPSDRHILRCSTSAIMASSVKKDNRMKKKKATDMK